MSKKSVWDTVLTSAFLILCALLVSLTGLCAGKAHAEPKAFEYLIADSDTRYLSREEITSMPVQVVCYAKNEIYARRGRTFVSKELSGYFGEQPWYYGFISPEDFSNSLLNQYEAANVQLLTEREKELMPGGYVLDRSGYSYDTVYQYLYGGEVLVDWLVDSSYIFPDSDTRYLEQSEIDRLSLQAICYAKNEIFARHGRMFVSQELTDYFNSKDWYVGNIRPENFSMAIFNTYETANVQLLSDSENARMPGGYQLDQPGYDIYNLSGGVMTDMDVTESAFIFYDSDTRYLTESEVQSLSLKMACYAKNEIYARRGRLFQSQELKDYFEEKSWYYGRISPESFSDEIFNKYELENIRVLTEWEYYLDPKGYQLY
ncbi:MAG: YARHG domain-containing protein [Candidatus Limivivens sp.]|nr:YARHG domain-containing protein [Candidatus Limivivens sp.]